MTPTKSGGRMKGHSTINKTEIEEYTFTLWASRGMAFEHSKEIRKFAMKKMGTPDVCVDTRVSRAVWANGMRKVLHLISVLLSRRWKEDEESSLKLYPLAN
ncbi:60S ribosomal protein L31 [Camelus dromedarius]|uniref:60S ribosomal protein L31 n=1 Tax=Camelus dromedarius TaxID=9838 RepID=A0A5N4EI62_CAMDR|nr:60S ribosomal protein L31 [Camelus dromedarius]